MKMTKVAGHPGDDADKPEQRVVFLDWATCDNVSQWSVDSTIWISFNIILLIW